MSFSKDNGYTPLSIDEIMSNIMDRVNENFGTEYTEDTFLGTNFYKFFYSLAQRLQENEVKTSEIFLKLQNYFKLTNESLARPNTTVPGLIDYFATQGYEISVKPPIEAEAGELSVAVNLDTDADDYAAQKTAFATILKNCVVAGVVTLGDITETITLSNSQSFDFKFNVANKIPIKLKLTLTLSDNNQFAILDDTEVANILFDNINSRYKFGLNFEPQRYFAVSDAPWASSVLLQYSLDGGSNWLSAVATLNFDDLYTFALGDITVIEA